MLNNTAAETNIMYVAQSRLFINLNIEDEIIHRGNNYHPEFISFVRSDLSIFRDAQYNREDRFSAWQARKHDMRARAALRLRNRLAYEDEARPYDPNALGHLFRSTSYSACRQPFAALTEAMRDTIKACRAGDRAEQRAGKQRLVELVYNVNYTALVYEVMGKHWPILRAAAANVWQRFDSGHWKKPVWDDGGWIDRHLTHFVHASRETPGNVAFYADTDKLEADRLTSMKAGRYLSAFYGDVLSAEQIKQWANKQVASTRPTELKFIGNDDPLGWVWVYENSTPSCMRFRRSNRYINHDLNGEHHPVTVYAHPENNLALAYIMLPGEVENRTLNCLRDDYVVGGRTIVNTKTKTYLRIYAAGDVQFTAMNSALESAGYAGSGGTLRNEKLRLVGTDGGYLCPYLDGHYTFVTIHSSHLLIGDSGVHAQETCGYVCEDEDEDEDEDRYFCVHCENYYDDGEDGGYVEAVGEWVCASCQSEDFVWAIAQYGNGRQFSSDSEHIVYCAYDGEYYVTDYLGDNGMGMTEDGGVYPENQLVGTHGGVYHIDNAVELTYAYNDYGWARRARVYNLPNGETCHVDDADKIAEIEALEQEAA